MALPKDAILLFSVVNVKLRDFYSSLDALCEDLGEDRKEIEQTLRRAGYVYNESTNQFEQE